MDNDLTDLNIEWIKTLQTVLAELWDWVKQMSLLPFENRTSASLICHLRKDVQEIIRTLKTDFPELRIKEYHGKSDPEEKNKGIFPYVDSIIQNKDVSTVRLEAGMVISIIEPIPKSDENDISLSQVVKAKFSIIKAEEMTDIANANILNHETAEFLEKMLKKTLEEMRSLDRHHIVKYYEISSESLTEDFISKYGDFNHMSLVPKMAQVFDNVDASCSAKKLGFKTIQAKLSLLNLALHVTYGLKFKAINTKHTHYHLVSLFDSGDAPKLLLYQTGEEIYWENGEDTQYAYSKLSSDKLLLEKFSEVPFDHSSSRVNSTKIIENKLSMATIQDLFNIWYPFSIILYNISEEGYPEYIIPKNSRSLEITSEDGHLQNSEQYMNR
ncbi:hypothetical protein C1645_830615 [Glomus cerebriforme]|uniref:Uncharacterized protein n=1 Tax=Glomus cerebriforme TaxID=658196 RepID=A0A397SND4_9GLOM|nr:hypothetical protein C1645_830615 [Glomus cerebriforme]